MKVDANEIIQELRRVDLRATPQRCAILKAIKQLNNHPTADEILEYIHKKQPNVAVGTVYNTLDTLVNSGLLKRVKTDSGSMRYDGVLHHHHHLYCSRCGKIMDYNDADLDKLMNDFFSKKGIQNFAIQGIRLDFHGHCTTKQQAEKT